MIVASWNVNSIRARQERVLQWLRARRPDVLCLQETKVVDESFPADPLREIGYEVAVHGQKAYNGVAIVSTSPLEDTVRGFEGGEDESGARLISARVRGVVIYSVYVPNGQVVGSAAYDTKLRFVERLRRLLERRHDVEDRVALCGDFNIAPEDRDVHDPDYWKTQVLFHPTSRDALRDLCAFGLVDTFRLHNEEDGQYSWWDYRQRALEKNRGLRIDHVLASKPLAALCTGAEIDREERRGENPSDHAPILAHFDL